MATAAVQQPFQHSFEHRPSAPLTSTKDKKLEKHDVDTVLNFFKDNADGSPPASTYVGKPETFERPYEPRNVTIRDVSGDEDKYTLDSHGFQYVRSVSIEKDFLDDAQIKDQYYKEIDQLLKSVTGATRTFIFDHTIRRSEPKSPSQGQETNDKPSADLRGPVKRVHIDQSYTASLSRVPHHLPADAPALLKGRVQIINVWRPIKPILRDPLALASAHSVSESDLVPVGLIYPDRKGETLSVRYNEKQEWFYKFHQQPEEALLIKCFDSSAQPVQEGKGVEGRAKRVPHTAFEVPGTEDELGRESIEVRVLVFHEDDRHE